MNKIKYYVIALVTALVVSSCGTTRTVPITGRKQNLMGSDAEILSLSTQEYNNQYRHGAACRSATGKCCYQLPQQ